MFLFVKIDAMRIFLLFISAVCMIAGCQTAEQSENLVETPEMVLVNDTIPLIRTEVSKLPVATYYEKVPDSLNDWKLAVEIYETASTFSYLMDIRYKELQVTDTLVIPRFGILPKIDIQKSSKVLACIVGFEDSEQHFKPYKVVEINDDQLRIKVLKHYRTGIFRKEN